MTPMTQPPISINDGNFLDGSASASDLKTILVGIDWADEKHAFELLSPNGQRHAGSILQDPQAIAEWIAFWQKKCCSVRFHICIETSHGAVVNALREHPQVTIYPVNPNALANYRKAFAHGGGKNDPVDAKLILQYLQHYRDQLRPLSCDLPLTRELDALCKDRRGLVQQRVDLANELSAVLKAYFPAVLRTKPSALYAKFVVRLLQKYPTLELLQKAGRHKLRKHFFGYGTKARIEERIEILMTATPLSTDEVLLRASSRRVQAICGQLESLNKSICGYDAEIKRLVASHADYVVVSSLPGAAYKTQARIIAALGDDRSRYGNASALQAATGIAPLTTQSGQMRFVSSRWACSKFLKQTFHEYAALSINQCEWAKAYYQLQISKGKSTQMARRALAFKWERIIYRCWQNREAYDDARYVERLRVTNSPLIKLMDEMRSNGTSA